MTHQFTVVVERDPESGWLVGEVTELPGCYTQAQDMAEVEKKIREAVTSGKKIPKEIGEVEE